MQSQGTIADRLRAAQQRLRGIQAELKEGLTLLAIHDRHDVQQEISRLEKLLRKEQNEQFNERQFQRLQNDLFA